MITIQDIIDADARVRGHAIRTPLITSSAINVLLQKQVWFKCENLQISGSFKLRGAANRLLALTDEQRARGVVAYSSGNHGKAIAYLGNKLGIPVTLVLSKDTSSQKVTAATELGAKLVMYDPVSEDRVAIADAIERGDGSVQVPPYEDEMVIAGQGTTVYEALQQADDNGVTIGAIITPVGGGGLLAGSSIAAKYHSSSIDVFGSEPVSGNDLQLSLEKGDIVRVEYPDTIAEGLRTNEPGKIAFPYLKRNVDGVLTTSDDGIRKAMRLTWDELKIVVEPAGVVPLAALIENITEVEAENIIVVLSGGNISFEDYSAALHTDS